MRRRGTWRLLGTAWLVLAAAWLPARVAAPADAPRPPSPEGRAAALRAEYLALAKRTEQKSAWRRHAVLREIATLRVGPGDALLLSVVRTSGDAEDRAAALLGACREGGLETVRKVCAIAEKHADEVVPELLAEGLSGSKDAEVQAWIAGPALDAATPRTARAALRALQAHPPEGARERATVLARAWQGPEAAETAAEAVRVLGALGVPEARQAIVEVARGGPPLARAAAADALATVTPLDPDALAALRDLLQDPVPLVRQAAAAAAGRSRAEALVPDLIAALGDTRLRTRHEAAVALRTLTRQELGHDAAAWAAWWRTKQGQSAKDVTVVTYHGLPVWSDRVLFVVDVSGSMSRPPDGPVKRIDVARRELLKALRGLPREASFNVVLFSDEVSAWKAKEEPATPEAVDAAVRWAERGLARPQGDTHTWEALRTAFLRNPGFDTLYVLSDGLPTHGDYVDERLLVTCVRAWNRSRRALLHTIALTLEAHDPGMIGRGENPQAMQRFLADLAAATGGETRAVRRAE